MAGPLDGLRVIEVAGRGLAAGAVAQADNT